MRGGGGLRGLSQWVQLCSWNPNELWRSNSIFNLTYVCTFRYWTGAVWWYRSAAEAPSIGAARTGVKLEAGAVQGRTVGTGQLLLALDSGALQLINLCTEQHEFKVQSDGTGQLLLALDSGALQLLNLCTEQHEFKVQSVQGSSSLPWTRGPYSSSTSAQSSMSLRYSRYRAAPPCPGLGENSSSTSAQSSMSLRHSRYRAAPPRPGLRGPTAPQPLHRATWV